MKFDYERQCGISIYYRIIVEDDKGCPLSKIHFQTEQQVKDVVDYLNKLVTIPRFELREYNTSLPKCYSVWDNLKEKDVPYPPLITQKGNPRDQCQKYVDFLNKLYEETPINL